MTFLEHLRATCGLFWQRDSASVRNKFVIYNFTGIDLTSKFIVIRILVSAKQANK